MNVRLAGRLPRILTAAVLAVHIGSAAAEAQDAALKHSVEQLRSTVGRWNVATNFLNPDGSVAKSVTGTYEFSWIVGRQGDAAVHPVQRARRHIRVTNGVHGGWRSDL